MSIKRKLFLGLKTTILSASLAFTAHATEQPDSSSLREVVVSNVKNSTHFFHKLHDDHLTGTKILAVMHSIPTLYEVHQFIMGDGGMPRLTLLQNAIES